MSECPDNYKWCLLHERYRDHDHPKTFLTFHDSLRDIGKYIVKYSEMKRLRPGIIRSLRYGHAIWVWEWQRKGSGDRFRVLDFPKTPKSGDIIELPHPSAYEPFTKNRRQDVVYDDEMIDYPDDKTSDEDEQPEYDKLDYQYDASVSCLSYK